MLYKYLLLFVLAFCGWSISIKAEDSKNMLIMNMESEAVLPKHFRTAQSPFKVTNQIKVMPSRSGLDQLHISGSGQFSEKALQVILKTINQSQNVYIVDLRQESHGFLNGNAISWYVPKNWINVGKSIDEVLSSEQRLLNDLAGQKEITIHKILSKDSEGIEMPETTSIPVKVKSVLSERQMVEQLPGEKLTYIRFPVTDHVQPTDEVVDLFIQFVTHLPQDHWLHFHCSAGVGRTTTFMLMYDMMKNAKNVSFDDIINRQWLIGGSNMRKVFATYSWKIPYGEKRTQFLEKFYEYCKNNNDHFRTSWSMSKK